MASSSSKDVLDAATGQASHLDSPDTHVHFQGLENQPLHDSPSKTWNNPKKRPSTSDLLNPSNAPQPAPHQPIEYNPADSHPQKRSRAADWPLRSTDDSDSSIITRRPANKSPISPAQRRNQARKARPSQFLEGSMNDRVSKKPPSIYLRDDEAMEQYHNHISSHTHDSDDTAAVEDEKTYYDAGIETTKPSGMYRFGKALASAFNPVSVWQGINGYWKVKDDHKQTDKCVLDERKIKAEKAYAELKRNGAKGTRPFALRGSSIDGSGFSDGTTHRYSMDSSFRDSGVDIDDHRTKSNYKQPTPAGSEDMLIATTLLRSRRAISPLLKEETGRKTSLSLPRPSLQGLKKAKSHFNLSAPKKKVGDTATPVPNPTPSSEFKNQQRLKRQPSKKDITKQRKLSKQVSDLETKLQTARYELELSRGQVPDVPKIPKSGRLPFKPGALPSLPSESFLNSTEERFPAESEPEWKPSNSRKHPERSLTPKKSAIKITATKTTPLKGKRESKGQETAPTSSGKKRKLSAKEAPDQSYKPAQSMANGSDLERDISGKKSLSARQMPEPVGAFKGTRQAVARAEAAAPPVSVTNTRFDAAKVDKEKLLAMRSVPKDNLPFGSHLDDIVNLQKEYPHVGQKMLDEYLSSLKKDGKPNMKSESSTKAEKSEATPPAWTRQAHRDSSPKKSNTQNLSTIDEAIIMNPSKDGSIPPVPRSPMKESKNPPVSRPSKNKATDKPLPAIQKEDFEWPEDVF
ncbi:MAG: hypothetical protein Q9169_004997 [Polycauliona sp. 2 TL-2023]